MSPLPSSLPAVLVALGVALSPASAATDPDLEFFEDNVRPILFERCYECHGEEKQKGGLRLDHAAGVLEGGDSGPAIVPGRPEESLLIEAVSWADPDFEMPPKNKLPDQEIATLKEWIARGAPDPRETLIEIPEPRAKAEPHWAYQPVQAHPIPDVANTAWPDTDVDRFLLSRLEEAGLQPVADSDRRNLIRRLTFALHGLPPTPEAIAEFVEDSRPDALEALVDSLLESPRFGERWGRHWLDVVRFGESVTLRGLVFHDAWRYRDYVIESFNADRPYDRFLREQIAGDLLPADTLAQRQRQVVATTFLALGNTNFEEQDKEQLEMDFIDEQLDTIGKAFLAQTIGCARCHDHMFDPIPTRDYYALAGILRNARAIEHANVSKWVEVPLPLSPEEEARLREHEERVEQLTTEVASAKDALSKLQTALDKPATPNVVAANDLPGVVIDSADATPVGEWQLSQYTGRYIGDGYLHDQDRDKGLKTLTFNPVLPGPGAYEVRLAYSHDNSRATNVPVTILHAEGETTVYVNQRNRPPVDGRFVVLGTFRFERGNQGSVLVSNAGTIRHVTADAVQFVPPPTTFGGENADRPDPSAPAETNEEALAVEAAREALNALEQRLGELKREGPTRPTVMSIREDASVGDIPIHVRGSVHNLGEIAPRGFLTIATPEPPPEIPEGESGRRELAEWLTDPGNPLTARVMVNRVWHWLFGAGLVRGTENFGTTGNAPSHPELLDHLAAEFIADDWSIKRLIRRLVMSRAYRLSSTDDPEGLAVDPENRLLWRMNRWRLDAESLRDSMLQIGGQLDLTMGGPTVPAGLKSDYDFRYDAPRRSVYVPVLRNSLPELFEVFDFADPSMVVGERNISTVAPQALYLLNHPFVMTAARHTAERVLKESGPEPDARAQRLYQLALGRPPSNAELELAETFLAGSQAGSDTELESLAQLAQALFASLDFRHVN